MKLDPEQGDFVKIKFKELPQPEEGIVVFWGKDRAVIKAHDSQDLLIINKPEDNILAIKIVVEPNHHPLDIAQTEELKPDKYYKDERLRAMSLTGLRQLQAEEERKRARELMTSFKAQGLPEVEYGLQPTKLQPVPHYSTKETKFSNSGNKAKRRIK